MSDDSYQTDPDCICWATVDDGKFLMVVTRSEDNIRTATLRVSVQETDEELLNEEVGLSFGAVFGPDTDDVRLWQEKTIAHIDAWIAAHP